LFKISGGFTEIPVGRGWNFHEAKPTFHRRFETSGGLNENSGGFVLMNLSPGAAPTRMTIRDIISDH